MNSHIGFTHDFLTFSRNMKKARNYLLSFKKMIVYIMRHGEAEANSSSNGERHLTERGASQVTNVLHMANQMGASITAIASSPLVRAKQTAEIAKRILKVDYFITNSLEPEGSPEEIYVELSKYNSSGVLLVSHQPLVSKLLSDLLGAEARISFLTGTVAMVKVDGQPGTGRGMLVLLIPPQIPIS